MNRCCLPHLALVLVLALAGTLTGCDRPAARDADANRNDAPSTPTPAAVPNLAVISDDDPELAAAMQAARDTLDGARHRWLAATREEREAQYFIKFFIEAGDRREYLWLSPRHWSPFRIEGILLNEPRLAPDLKPGELVDVPIERIADWLIRLPERTDGGYTLAVLKSRGRGVREGTDQSR